MDIERYCSSSVFPRLADKQAKLANIMFNCHFNCPRIVFSSQVSGTAGDIQRWRKVSQANWIEQPLENGNEIEMQQLLHTWPTRWVYVHSLFVQLILVAVIRFFNQRLLIDLHFFQWGVSPNSPLNGFTTRDEWTGAGVDVDDNDDDHPRWRWCKGGTKIHIKNTFRFEMVVTFVSRGDRSNRN